MLLCLPISSTINSFSISLPGLLENLNLTILSKPICVISTKAKLTNKCFICLANVLFSPYLFGGGIDTIIGDSGSQLISIHVSFSRVLSPN